MINSNTNQEIINRALPWTTDAFDRETRQTVQKMIDNPNEEFVDAFYKDLEFGTGGLRGIMGPGTNRMNRYTVGMSTQGLANYLKSVYPDQKISIAIAFDCRHNSPQFAKICTDVLSGNGIKVFLFESLRPTPELSFAIRHYGCNSGIMITASHNPKEYNGYKVYWNDGAQLVLPHDLNVIKEAGKIKSIEEVIWDGNPKLVQIIGQEIDDLYIQNICTLSMLEPSLRAKWNNLPIVYSPLHGTGTAIVPKALQAYGFTNIMTEPLQSVPDGDFPTVTSPNPEEGEALALSISMAKKNGADLVMATDPDADRVGIAVKNDDGDFVLLNGNQTATIVLYYLLEQWKKQGKITGNQYLAKTIVTTYLIDKMAEDYGVECFNVLTGFKYIGEVMRNFEGVKEYIAGGEESYGLLVGDFVRDKDAVSACCIIAEALVWAKERGMTLTGLLRHIHEKFGLWHEHLLSVTKKGRKGAKEIREIMDKFRNNTPKMLAGQKVVSIHDFLAETITDTKTRTTKPTGLAKSNVLQLLLEDGSLITMRPSGTEPKIKFYFSVHQSFNNNKQDYQEVLSGLKKKITLMITEMGL